MLKTAHPAFVAFTVALACGCSPRTENATRPAVSGQAIPPATASEPLAQTPAATIPSQSPDESPAATHGWWRGSGPEIRLTAPTDEETRKMTVDPDFANERVRQAQAKVTLVSVTLHLAADRKLVEEAIVVITPPDPTRALSTNERLRAEVEGVNRPNRNLDTTSPRFLTSREMAPLDADGRFAMTGFVRAKEGNPLDQPDPAVLSDDQGTYVLRGQLQGDSLVGTLECYAPKKATPTHSINWKGAYLPLSDAEVEKQVEALRGKFDP